MDIEVEFRHGPEDQWPVGGLVAATLARGRDMDLIVGIWTGMLSIYTCIHFTWRLPPKVMKATTFGPAMSHALPTRVSDYTYSYIMHGQIAIAFESFRPNFVHSNPGSRNVSTRFVIQSHMEVG